jgi:hypothetical protein
MSTDYHALCIELLRALEGGRLLWKNGYAHWVITPDADPLCQRARAALDQPEPTLTEQAMTDQHPITPSFVMVEKWLENWHSTPGLKSECRYEYIATCAAQWGADQELVLFLMLVDYQNIKK